MPKIAKALQALAVSRLTKPGFYAVGTVKGLHLRVKPKSREDDDEVPRSWVLRVVIGDKRRDVGLGAYPTKTLADAWAAARAARDTIEAGRDPVDERRAQRVRTKAEQAKAMTFRVAAEKVIAQKTPEWKNAKHAAQWMSTLKTYAFPFIGDKDVGDIDSQDVLRALEPIWATKTETATRVRSRIETVIAWDDVRVNRDRLNPARWTKHLEMSLAKPTKITKVEHHAAIPVQDVPHFMKELRQREGMGARALEFLVLTAARSGEVRGATWQEINLKTALWVIPAERMKAAKEHRVPLSKAAVKLLRALPRMEGSEHVFPSAKGVALSDMTLSEVTRRMGVAAVPHGFRSTFRDWAAEMTSYPAHVAEMALAHTIGNKVEAAYRRGDLFDKRVAMMEDWSKFLSTGPTVKPTAKAPAKRAAKPVPKKAAVKTKGATA